MISEKDANHNLNICQNDIDLGTIWDLKQES